jgi:acetyltransferase-like isoleucine patch superfamily enzyme
MGLLTLLRGVWLLRRPEALRMLGDLAAEAAQREQWRRAYPKAHIHADASILGWRPERLTLAEDVRIEKGTILALGDDFNGYGQIMIGPRSWIGPYNNFRLAHECKIEIGADCLISQFVSLVAANHDLGRERPMRSKPCSLMKTGITLGNDVWLGAGATIMPGTHLGDGVVIGANSVVTCDIPAYEIWGGVPARRLGERP